MAQAVNVMDIVDSRSQEITAAMEALTTNMSVSVKLSIPFYMRRRAASHNPKRLPARVRPPDAGKSKAKFKWKKRSGRKDEDCVKTDDDKSGDKKAKRLETHLWHAKRCHMTDRWGYRIAECSTQKGARAAHRATNTATTIQDTSFHQWVSLTGQSLHSSLTNTLVPNYLALDRVTCSHVYHEGVCLGPARVYWVSEHTVFLCLHPGIPHHTDLATVFTGLSYTPHTDTLSQFTLQGVRSLELLVKSLVLSDNTDSVVKEIWEELSENPFCYDVMGGAALGCTVVIPPPQHRNFVSVLDAEIAQPAHRLSPDSSLCGGLLFRSVLGDKTDNTDSHQTDNTDSYQPDKTEETLPCCIYKDPETGSLTVLLPRGTGTRVWISLIYNGARVIGLRDSHSLHSDRSIPCFPADYPDTLAGRIYLEEEGREKEGLEMRRPPQKRVRYEELGILSPFVSDWGAVCGGEVISVIRSPALLNKLESLPSEMGSNFVTVSVTCVKRGNIRPGAHIYYLDQTTSRDQNTSRDQTKPRDQTTSGDPVYSSEDKYPLVGYVTSGKYCLATGGGAGIALILTSIYKKIGEGGVLLVRNTTSKQYRHVRITVVK